MEAIKALHEQQGTTPQPGTTLVTREPVEGTPFVLIKPENQGWFIALGRHKLTEGDIEKEELLKMIKERDWTLLIAVVNIACEYYVPI